MKKTTFTFIILFVLTLTSCSKSDNAPLTLAKLFDEKDYEVKMFVDNEEIREFSNDFEINHKGIRCVISVVPDNGNDYQAGIFIYFESTDSAKEATWDLESCADENNFSKTVIRFTIKRRRNLVFVGCEDAWQEI